VRIITRAGVVWLVDVVKARHRIEVRAAGQAEAWHLASEQAEALGMLNHFPKQESES
jgi:hypothetical protein